MRVCFSLSFHSPAVGDKPAQNLMGLTGDLDESVSRGFGIEAEVY